MRKEQHTMSCQQRNPCRLRPPGRAGRAPSTAAFLFAGLFSLSLLAACGDRSIQMGDLFLASRPSGLPQGFPAELVYQNAQIEMMGQLDTAGFWSPAQYAVSFRAADDGDSVRAFYMQYLRQERWQILQSRHFDTEKKTIIVAESPMQRIMTLIIPDGPGSQVQLYLKRSTDN